MRDALTQLYNLIALTDPADKPKILVRVELVGGMVQYHPPIDKESADISVQVSVQSFTNLNKIYITWQIMELKMISSLNQDV